MASEKRSGVCVSKPRLVTMGASMVAFALLIAMFAKAGNLVGTVLCTANLALRVCETGRYLWLCVPIPGHALLEDDYLEQTAAPDVDALWPPRSHAHSRGSFISDTSAHSEGHKIPSCKSSFDEYRV